MQGHKRKMRVGTVVSHKMNKTAVVAVERLHLDKKFKKYLKGIEKFKVHDEKNESRVGDRVQVVETRPLSKEKRWRLQAILVREEIEERTESA